MGFEKPVDEFTEISFAQDKIVFGIYNFSPGRNHSCRSFLDRCENGQITEMSFGNHIDFERRFDNRIDVGRSSFIGQNEKFLKNDIKFLDQLIQCQNLEISLLEQQNRALRIEQKSQK